MQNTIERDKDSKKWMAIERALYTIDGRSCDKIGTSFTPFISVQDRCNKPVDTCLKNQLTDYWNVSMKRMGYCPLSHFFVNLLIYVAFVKNVSSLWCFVWFFGIHFPLQF